MIGTNGIFRIGGDHTQTTITVTEGGMDQPGSIKVYVVEDSPAILAALSLRIEDDLRFTVVGYANTAQDALAELAQRKPHVLILDLQLKQGTGYDILTHLRSTGLPAELKIIVLTNYASAAHRRRAMELGADSFFDKSMQFDEMLDQLRVWADGNGSKPTQQ